MIRHWAVIDLNVWRRLENDAGVRKEIQSNSDGTHFIAYDIRSFPPELLIAVSPTMAFALEQGVDAVERLPAKSTIEMEKRLRERWLTDPAPDLHELIAQYGGYHLIPQQAWREHDTAMARWQARRKMAP